MVVTRSGRTSGKIETPKLELLHDHHAPKPLKVAKKDSYKGKRCLTNVDANVSTHPAFTEGETHETHDSKLQTTPHVMSSQWNGPAASVSASQRENCTVSGSIRNYIEERANNFFQRSNHDNISQTEKTISLHNVVGHKNLSLDTAHMNSSQREGTYPSLFIGLIG